MACDQRKERDGRVECTGGEGGAELMGWGGGNVGV